MEYEVVGVRFKEIGKIYYFNPKDLKIKNGTNVVCDTKRGLEYGTVVLENRFIKEEDAILPLKEIIRIATEEDNVAKAENIQKEKEAFNICLEKIKKHKLEMKLIDVEFTLDRGKLLFYFTADGRIDFRDLVKDLASIFKTRIELRQIGIRDETKILNGIGICGITLCCATFLGEFQPVSIKMAKDQGLALNPTKISGVCGRLMCCLKYEEESYLELKQNLPNIGDIVETADGIGEVINTSILRQEVKVSVNKKDTKEKNLEIYSVKDIKIKKSKKEKKKKEKLDEEILGLLD